MFEVDFYTSLSIVLITASRALSEVKILEKLKLWLILNINVELLTVSNTLITKLSIDALLS